LFGFGASSRSNGHFENRHDTHRDPAVVGSHADEVNPARVMLSGVLATRPVTIGF
jgi:hypothetical protein